MNKRQNPRANEQNSSSIEEVFFNYGLLAQILLHIPVKSLLLLKLVSKDWRNVIIDPAFCCLHNTTTESCPRTAPSGLILHQYMANKYMFLSLLSENTPISQLKTLAPPSFLPPIRILHSYNGLLCFSTGHPADLTTNFFVFNPTTKQFAPLPRPGQPKSLFSVIHGMTLAFDPIISSHYRVVSVQSSSISSDQYWVEIYSKKACKDYCWRVCGKPFTPTSKPWFTKGVYWNEAVHWVSDEGDSFYFDIAREEVLKMPMPPGLEEERSIGYFGESNGHLYLVDDDETDTLIFNVYELEKNYSGWFVKYQIDLTSIASAYPQGCGIDDEYQFVILSIVQGEREEEYFLVLQIEGQIIRYQFTIKSYKSLCYYGKTDDASSLRFCRWYNVFPHFESLACV